jgi:hypothetical protein
MKIDPYLPPCTKLKSKWMEDLNIKPGTLNLIEEKVGKSLELIGTGGNFLNRTPMAQVLRSSVRKCMVLFLGLQFYSIDQHICLCTNTMQFFITVAL